MITLFLGILLIYNLVKNYHALHIFQQNLYNTNNRYLKWIKKRKKEVFLSLDILIIILLIFSYKFKILIYISGLFYLFNCLYLINYYKNMKVKKPFIITKRIIRLNITYYLLFLIPIIIYFIKPYNYLLLILSIFTYFNYFIIYLVNIINKPIEKLVYKYYERLAKKKLHSMPNLKVIGITGSYGKTSSKNILNTILKQKYITLATPKNLNTEYGLMITINNYLDKFTEMFIAEMGAYKKGEIKTLCEMVHPKYAILTRIGLAHLESFGSIDNIIKTKFELVEALPSDGVAILNLDDENQRNYQIKNNCQKIWIGIDNKKADIYASEIKQSYQGSTFLVYINKKSYEFKTKLLGAHNIYNILAAVALGYHLGMSVEELKRGVALVKPVESRLELRDYGYMYQINDAYNSNPIGANMAVDVLRSMPGEKILVTPGMTELGEKENDANYNFGCYMAFGIDLIILVGKKQTEYIYKGLKDKNYPLAKVIIVNSVYEAYDIIKKMAKKNKVYALFENDLPDIYNE